MPTVGTTSKPAYVYDAGTDTWVPVGVGAHTHDTSALVSVNNHFAAGKNKIINGDFKINQRAFSSTTTSDSYGFDRWFAPLNDGTCTYSAQTFTSGAAPVAGYESANFARIVTTGQTLASARAALNQRMEDVRTFAGQTVTVSFWAKAATGTPSIAIEFAQNFGSGGSPSVSVSAIGAVKVAITTSWVRYSSTISIPSISGKTIGTTANTSFLQLALYVSAGTDYNARTGSLGIQTGTFDIWGVQVEAGSVATPFTTHTGSIQGELAACQRYYYRITSQSNYGYLTGPSATASTNGTLCPLYLPVTMRTIPTLLEYANIRLDDAYSLAYGITTATIQTTQSTPQILNINVSAPSQTVVGRWYLISANNNPNAYIGVGAEL